MKEEGINDEQFKNGRESAPVKNDRQSVTYDVQIREWAFGPARHYHAKPVAQTATHVKLQAVNSATSFCWVARIDYERCLQGTAVVRAVDLSMRPGHII